MGMRACEAAKTAFMVDMYWLGSDCDTDSTRIRACRFGADGCVDGAVVGFAGSADVLGGSKARDVLCV